MHTTTSRQHASRGCGSATVHPFRATVCWLMTVLAILASAGGAEQTALAQNIQQQIYNGVATTTVQLATIYGTPRGTSTYRTSVQVVIGPPRSAGAVRETNPFRLSIQSMPLTNAPGEITLWSGLPAEGTFFQYWQIQPISAHRWQGVLTDNHTREALAMNVMTLPMEIAPHIEMPNTVAMANGTRMTGQVEGNQLTLTVEGNSTGGNTPFRTQIVAKRVP